MKQKELLEKLSFGESIAELEAEKLKQYFFKLNIGNLSEMVRLTLFTVQKELEKVLYIQVYSTIQILFLMKEF